MAKNQIEQENSTQNTGENTEPTAKELAGTIKDLLDIVQQNSEENEKLRNQIADIEERRQKENDELREIIEGVGDKARVNNWRLKNTKQGPSEFRINTYGGKVVLSWDKMKFNLVYKNELKATVEKLVSTLHFADGSSEDVDYQKWQMDRVMVPAVATKINKDEMTGERIVVLKVLRSPQAEQVGLKPDTEFTINVKFLN